LWLPSASGVEFALGVPCFSALPSASGGEFASGLALFSALPSASADGWMLCFLCGALAPVEQSSEEHLDIYNHYSNFTIVKRCNFLKYVLC
jgi:hypothetical protein